MLTAHMSHLTFWPFTEDTVNIDVSKSLGGAEANDATQIL